MTYTHLFWGDHKRVLPLSKLSTAPRILLRVWWLLWLTPLSLSTVADDTASVDAIIDAYYEVISGPAGFVYDADRDANIHAQDALITKFLLDGTVQQNDFEAEQASIVSPYESPFFEFEVDRKIEQFGNIAHVWSEFEMKTDAEGDAYGGGFNSISLLFMDGRWWISSWSTQYKDPTTGSQESAPTQLTDLNTDEFAKVVKSIVQDTLQACEVQGGMQGRAKINLAVVGEVNAKLVCSEE